MLSPAIEEKAREIIKARPGEFTVRSLSIALKWGGHGLVRPRELSKMVLDSEDLYIFPLGNGIFMKGEEG